MTHCFNTDVAAMFGDANVAVLFENICYWIAHNRANNKNAHEVSFDNEKTTVIRYFTFNSVSAFSKQFPYLSSKQIERCIQKLREAKLIHKTTFNTVSFIRTSWYCLVDEDFWIKNYLGEPSKASSLPSLPTDTPDADDETGPTTPDNDHMGVNNSPKTGNGLPENGKCIPPKREMDFPKTGNAFPQIGKWIPRKREMHSPKTGNGFPEIGKSITDSKHSYNPNKKPSAAIIKSMLQTLDAQLVYDSDFYAAAASFLTIRDLDADYMAWLYRRVRDNPDVKNIRSYFFSLFFQPAMKELYLARDASPAASEPEELQAYTCPVCEKTYTLAKNDILDFRCARCECPHNPDAQTKQRYVILNLMDTSTRKRYDSDVAAAFGQGDVALMRMIDATYGIGVS